MRRTKIHTRALNFEAWQGRLFERNVEILNLQVLLLLYVEVLQQLLSFDKSREEHKGC